ncbi:O-antigen polymerase [Acinetobacter sp. A1-4-2]|uniref:O-antigen polymerase n=1 Tax=Acinetobacter sp. A1-4-2 TaxID=3156489 RepID=A0AAU7T1Q5_9GAMM
MLLFSSILLCIITLYGIKVEYDRKSPFVIFFFALILMSVLPTLSIALNFSESFFKYETYLEATLFSCLFLLVLIFVRFITVKIFKVEKIWKNIISINIDTKIITRELFILFFILSLAFILFLKGLNINSISSLMAVNWWDVVNGGFLIILATYLCYISSSILLSNYLYNENKKIKIAIYIQVLLFLIFSIFVLKTRSYILMFITPLFCYFLYTKKGVEVIKPIIFLFLMFFVFILARAVRHSSDLNDFLESDFLEGFEAASDGAENTLINGFYYFVQNNNNFSGFENNNTIKRIIFFAFPGIKPEEFSYIMHSAYYGSNPSDRLSIHPTVFGDAYGNAWWFGAFIYSSFLGLYIGLLELLNKFFDKDSIFRICVFSIICTVSLIFARGAIYNGFMYSLIPIIVCFVCFFGTKYIKFK